MLSALHLIDRFDQEGNKISCFPLTTAKRIGLGNNLRAARVVALGESSISLP
jgi:hypothetical protein